MPYSVLLYLPNATPFSVWECEAFAMSFAVVDCLCRRLHINVHHIPTNAARSTLLLKAKSTLRHIPVVRDAEVRSDLETEEELVLGDKDKESLFSNVQVI